MYLVIVDTTQIQPYIFGSNRLRENIGASHLVAEATEAWALEAVQAIAVPNNINSNGTLDNTKHIEDSGTNLAAEVLYAGGGNVVVLFRDEADARTFTRQLSRKTLTDAPNLQLIIVRQPFDWSQSLYKEVEATFKKLAEEKRSRSVSAPLLGLGVTVMCRSTGLPAREIVQPIPSDPTSAYPVSAEIAAKLDATDAANKRLQEMFAAVLDDTYAFPRDFDELGRSAGEHSYIAIVHADGDGIGKRIQEIGKRYQKPEQNRKYITELRQFSDAVERAAQSALLNILAHLKKKIDIATGLLVHKNVQGKELTRIELKREDGQWLLPFRPIVFGGDDVTFVCDGRLGVSLAVEYLRQFELHTVNLPDGKGKATACAGIAIVKTHYPFARAYELANELCKEAKTYRRKIKESQKDWNGSCLDWHFALGGLAGNIKAIREREYKIGEKSLTLRPLTLNSNIKEPQRALDVVQKGITAFQGEGWAGRRNKVKALRDTLREGSEAVKQFLIKFNDGRPLPDVEPSMTNWPIEGWQGGYCGYFDAIELADWFIPLQGGQTP
jgi:hypothetical protein